MQTIRVRCTLSMINTSTHDIVQHCIGINMVRSAEVGGRQSLLEYSAYGRVFVLLSNSNGNGVIRLHCRNLYIFKLSMCLRVRVCVCVRVYVYKGVGVVQYIALRRIDAVTKIMLFILGMEETSNRRKTSDIFISGYEHFCYSTRNCPSVRCENVLNVRIEHCASDRYKIVQYRAKLSIGPNGLATISQ